MPTQAWNWCLNRVMRSGRMCSGSWMYTVNTAEMLAILKRRLYMNKGRPKICKEDNAKQVVMQIGQVSVIYQYNRRGKELTSTKSTSTYLATSSPLACTETDRYQSVIIIQTESVDPCKKWKSSSSHSLSRLGKDTACGNPANMPRTWLQIFVSSSTYGDMLLEVSGKI